MPAIRKDRRRQTGNVGGKKRIRLLGGLHERAKQVPDVKAFAKKPQVLQKLSRHCMSGPARTISALHVGLNTTVQSCSAPNSNIQVFRPESSNHPAGTQCPLTRPMPMATTENSHSRFGICSYSHMMTGRFSFLSFAILTMSNTRVYIGQTTSVTDVRAKPPS